MKYYISTSATMPKNRLQKGINKMTDPFKKRVLSGNWKDFFVKITKEIEELNELNPRCDPAKVEYTILQVDEIIMLSIEIGSSRYQSIELHLIKGEITL